MSLLGERERMKEFIPNLIIALFNLLHLKIRVAILGFRQANWLMWHVDDQSKMTKLFKITMNFYSFSENYHVFLKQIRLV